MDDTDIDADDEALSVEESAIQICPDVPNPLPGHPRCRFVYVPVIGSQGQIIGCKYSHPVDCF